MTPDEIILKHADIKLNELKHFYDPSDYDPQAAHNYYERTKQLKGRRRGVTKARSGGSGHRAVSKKAPTKTAAQRRAEIEAKLPAMQAKLDQLRSVLTELVRQAKERAGVDTAKETTSKNLTAKTSNTSTSQKTDPLVSEANRLTAQQKQEAAKRAQEWRDAHQTPEQKASALEQQIAEVSQKIADLRAQAPKPKSTTANKSTKPVPRRGRS